MTTDLRKGGPVSSIGLQIVYSHAITFLEIVGCDSVLGVFFFPHESQQQLSYVICIHNKCLGIDFHLKS